MRLVAAGPLLPIRLLLSADGYGAALFLRWMLEPLVLPRQNVVVSDLDAYVILA